MINQADREILSRYSIEDLEKYIQTQQNELWVPITPEERDLEKFIDDVHKQLLQLQADSTGDERSDTQHAIFEMCLILLYGDGIWEWWNNLP